MGPPAPIEARELPKAGAPTHRGRRGVEVLGISEIFPPRVGGSGRWLWELYRRRPAGSCTVITVAHPESAAFDDAQVIAIHRTRFETRDWGVTPSALKGFWATYRRILKYHRADRPSLVHAARCLPEGVVALLLKLRAGTPYVVFAHGEDVSVARLSGQHRLWTRLVLRSAEAVVANSRNTARLLMEEWGQPEEKVRVHHPGVDTELFRPAQGTAGRPAEWVGRTVVLTVGRLQRRKGHDILVGALPEIGRHVPDVLYAIVGDGEERTRLEEIAERTGVKERVQFLGELADADVLNRLQHCDVFALPNREVECDIEGFGIVLLEAQACGKPVLAGRSGGTADTLKEGETGYLVPCETAEGIVAPLVRLLTDEPLRSKMGAAGREWVCEHFDWSRVSLAAVPLFERGERREDSP